MAIVKLDRMGFVVGNPEFFTIETRCDIRMIHSLGDLVPDEEEARSRFTIDTKVMVNVQSSLTYITSGTDDAGEPATVETGYVFFDEEIEVPSPEAVTVPYSQSAAFINMNEEGQHKFTKRVAKIHEKTAEKSIIQRNDAFQDSNPTRDTIQACDEIIERERRNIAIQLRKESVSLLKAPITPVQLVRELKKVVSDGVNPESIVTGLLERVNSSYSVLT